MSFSYASVIETVALSPRLRRICLHVEDSDALAVKQAPDSAVGIYFSAVDGQSGQGRTYSVRRQEGDVIVVDVVLHSPGLGATWARTTGLGDRVGLDHANSWYQPPAATQWQLLVSDLSGLPAV